MVALATPYRTLTRQDTHWNGTVRSAGSFDSGEESPRLRRLNRKLINSRIADGEPAAAKWPAAGSTAWSWGGKRGLLSRPSRASYSYTNENNDQKRGLCAHHHQSVARERRGAVEPLGHNHALAHDVTRTARLTVDVRPDLPPARYALYACRISRSRSSMRNCPGRALMSALNTVYADTSPAFLSPRLFSKSTISEVMMNGWPRR